MGCDCVDIWCENFNLFLKFIIVLILFGNEVNYVKKIKYVGVFVGFEVWVCWGVFLIIYFNIDGVKWNL